MSPKKKRTAKRTSNAKNSEDEKGSSKKKEKKTLSKVAKVLSKKFPAGMDLILTPSGSIMLDKILGGGVPHGRYLEIASKAGLGKSTMALHVCLSFIEHGLSCVYLDFEKAVNESLVNGVGLGPHVGEHFVLHKGDTFKELEELMDDYLETEDVKLIVIDSINSILPEGAVDGAIEEQFAGTPSRLQNQFLLKYKARIVRENVAVILINQMRRYIAQSKFEQSHDKPAGGYGLSHYSDIRMQAVTSKQITKTLDGERLVIGTDVVYKTTKNKVTRPFVQSVVSVLFGVGISNIRALAMALVNEKRAIKRTKQAQYFYVSLDPSVDLTSGGSPCKGELGLEAWVRENYDDCIAFLKGKGYLEIV